MRFIHSRTGHLAGILGLLALLGCGGGSGRPAGDASAYLQWNIYDVGGTTPLFCADVGAGSIDVTLDTNNTYTFACADTYDYIDNIPSGTYSITVQLYGDPKVYGNSTTLLDQITSTQTLYSGNNTLPEVDFLVNSFVLGWSITSGGLPTTCAAVGASWVALDIYYPGQTQATSYYFACDDVVYRDATLAIPMGPYAVQWQAFLLDAAYRDLTLTPGTQLTSYNVSASVQADLGYVVFPF